MASAGEELQKDLEEETVLLEKVTGKKEFMMLLQLKNLRQTGIKDKMQQKLQRKAEPVDNENPAMVVAPITMGYTVGISNYGWDQPDNFVRIHITLAGGHPVPTENLLAHVSERALDLLVNS